MRRRLLSLWGRSYSAALQGVGFLRSGECVYYLVRGNVAYCVESYVIQGRPYQGPLRSVSVYDVFLPSAEDIEAVKGAAEAEAFFRSLT